MVREGRDDCAALKVGCSIYEYDLRATVVTCQILVVPLATSSRSNDTHQALSECPSTHVKLLTESSP